MAAQWLCYNIEDESVGDPGSYQLEKVEADIKSI